MLGTTVDRSPREHTHMDALFSRRDVRHHQTATFTVDNPVNVTVARVPFAACYLPVGVANFPYRGFPA